MFRVMGTENWRAQLQVEVIRDIAHEGDSVPKREEGIADQETPGARLDTIVCMLHLKDMEEAKWDSNVWEE